MGNTNKLTQSDLIHFLYNTTLKNNSLVDENLIDTFCKDQGS